MEINNNDFIWYYKFLNDDYYGRPISGISELKRNKVKDIKYESIYHNATKTIYELDNGESINEIDMSNLKNTNTEHNLIDDLLK